ncbi:MAG: proline--tRNA ligase [Gammaproteobacteria bacterium RIFCSPHIGHO2_12_FULL_35_23]|nr:MAG: proline--tRNA ligase [Gammaproteobacteria bacterium RIFCSPHIGHO2_12_FULL_35_23]
MTKTAITPTRQENYPEWYQQVIAAADLAEASPVRGCMVIKPWGYAIWEAMQRDLDQRIKATGHVNAYFPLLIPLSYLEREAKHVAGFAKECAVVTHHRLEANEEGRLIPAGKLEEPYVIRPTSETIIGEMFAKWVQSYRDLPLLINQWANIMRWEMRTRLFLRTTEFLWQEGHTVHETKQEAVEETLKMLAVYAEFCENILAMPVIKGEKTASERFPGAVNTYCIEAMMQDKKALQAGTSHFLGQNFSKASHIEFLNQAGERQFAWTTSWGVSTRLIGSLIMVHSDDDGLVLPPKIAPEQIVILPIYRNETDRSKVLTYCQQLQQELQGLNYHHQPLRVKIDDRDLRGGDKNWQWVKKGVPVRLEIGLRDIDNQAVFMAQRHLPVSQKQSVLRNEFVATVTSLLDTIQNALLVKAQDYLQANTKEINTLAEFNEFFNGEGGFASCYALDDPAIEEFIKPLKVSARCIPFEQTKEAGICIFTGKKVGYKTIFAKAY